MEREQLECAWLGDDRGRRGGREWPGERGGQREDAHGVRRRPLRGRRFTTAGGRAANHIAKWDGTNWSPLASEVLSVLNDFVYALAVSGRDLYAGGQFTLAGG